MKNLYIFSRRFLSPSQLEDLLYIKDDWMFSRKLKSRIIILLSFLLMVVYGNGYAQAPYQFSYQGVARDASGKVVSNSNVTVRIKIHKDGPGGNVIFTETQIVPTNSSGIFNLVIGGLAGGLDNVNWGSNNCFLQTEIDVTGGSSFLDMGTTQLKSVPYALVSRKWVDNVPIVQTGSFASGPNLSSLASGSMLVWYPKKAAFRAGFGSESSWGDAMVGETSFAAGSGTKATGEGSSAFGSGSIASGKNSFAAGLTASATGLTSVALGENPSAQGRGTFACCFNTTASGEASNSFGWGTVAKALASTSLGIFNNDSDSPLPLSPGATDRIFQIGNGSNSANKSNAVTILRNGNVGIGNNVLDPTYLLDLGGRVRIRNNGATAGIHFNNSANNEDGFVGMKTDDEVGFWVNNNWRFWVNSSNAYVNGSVVNTSDRRLKERITALPQSLPLLRNLSGYHYYWKNKQQGTALQTGLIAQEVEEYFPELVATDKDGFKAVNYIGLIPHLIEAVKELDKKTNEIAELKKELASMQEMNKKLSALEASVKQLMAGQPAVSNPTGK